MPDMNPILNELLGGWQLSTINTANTGTPLNVYYTPSTANDVTGLTAEYRGEAFLRPNVACSGTNQGVAQSLLTYFAACTFSTPPANAPFGNLGRNAFRGPSLEQWDLAVNKNFRHHGRHRAPVPQRVFQRAKPHKFRRAESNEQQHRLRDDHDDVSAEADSVQFEIAVLKTKRIRTCQRHVNDTGGKYAIRYMLGIDAGSMRRGVRANLRGLHRSVFARARRNGNSKFPARGS